MGVSRTELSLSRAVAYFDLAIDIEPKTISFLAVFLRAASSALIASLNPESSRSSLKVGAEISRNAAEGPDGVTRAQALTEKARAIKTILHSQLG
jgi:hypothetical protein